MNIVNFIDYPTTTIVIALLNLPVYPLIVQTFYGERYEKLKGDVEYVFQSDWKSFLQGEFVNDYWAELRFKLCLLFCIGWPLALAEGWVRYFYL